MNLENIQNLSTAEKLLVLRSSSGKQQLQEWLEVGNSLRRIARMIGVDSKTLYRLRDNYPEIAEVIALYIPVKVAHEKVEPINLSRPDTYKIICAYENHKTYLKGSIYAEYSTPQELWASGFIQEYFNSFGVSACDYQAQYFEAINSKGTYFLSNYICATYCKVSAKGKIIPLAPTA